MEGRLAAWQNAPTSPTSTDGFLYDGSGQRVAQQVTASGSTTTSVYIGALAEYTLTGSTSWQKYYIFAGRLVVGDNGHWHELLQDQLGTTQVQLNASGAAESGSLRQPYGSTRYGSSAFMGDLGYTGQRKDSTPNLVYFNARYYDQDVGVFLSADTYAAGGLNRYAYVSGNPETATDPTGHRIVCGADCLGGGQSSGDPSGGSNSGSAGDTVRPTCNRGGCITGEKATANLTQCNGSTQECQAIRQTFHDPRTREVLYLLLYSSEGTLFLPFLLKEGGLHGDSYITWTSGSGGYTDVSGMIELGTQLLSAYGGDLTSNLINGANALIHEAVESFYADAYGIRTQASVHMDYVAQWFAGETSEQLNSVFDTSQFPNSQAAYQQTFHYWEHNAGLVYKEPASQGGLGEPETQWEVQDPLWRFLFQSAVPGGWPDEMGLNLHMLSSDYV